MNKVQYEIVEDNLDCAVIHLVSLEDYYFYFEDRYSRLEATVFIGQDGAFLFLNLLIFDRGIFFFTLSRTAIRSHSVQPSSEHTFSKPSSRDIINEVIQPGIFAAFTLLRGLFILSITNTWHDKGFGDDYPFEASYNGDGSLTIFKNVYDS